MMHTRYATLDDGALRALLPSDDAEVLMEVCNRFTLGVDEDYPRQISKLEQQLWEIENDSERIKYSEYEEVCDERDDLQEQVNVLTATFDALVNT